MGCAGQKPINLTDRLVHILREFYDKYYIRKHLVTTCQLGDCAQLEKLTMMRPTGGRGVKVDVS